MIAPTRHHCQKRYGYLQQASVRPEHHRDNSPLHNTLMRLERKPKKNGKRKIKTHMTYPASAVQSVLSAIAPMQQNPLCEYRIAQQDRILQQASAAHKRKTSQRHITHFKTRNIKAPQDTKLCKNKTKTQHMMDSDHSNSALAVQSAPLAIAPTQHNPEHKESCLQSASATITDHAHKHHNIT
jgi:hypothetical protein